MRTRIHLGLQKPQALANATAARTSSDRSLLNLLVARRADIAKISALEDMLVRFDVLMNESRFYRPQSLPKGYRRGAYGDSSLNAFRLAIRDRKLTYCHGLVLVPKPRGQAALIQHSWCVTTEGDVVDVTLRRPGLSYFGRACTKEEMNTLFAILMNAELLQAWASPSRKRRKSRR